MHSSWTVALLALGACLSLLLALYWPSLWSMVEIWRDSETFSHGFLVFPASAFLIWRSRERFENVAPAPTLLGAGLLVVALSGWLVSKVGTIQVGEQFSFVLALVAVVWAMLGHAVTRQMFFPLAFLFFAVPFGEVAIPHLMQFTAWFTVKALQVTGIPVYREGYFLSIPTGDFEIAKACSGIRYLIASFSLGTLYAYLTYHSQWRRIAFVLFAIALPIIANGLRAYGIVMLAHLSEMRLAVGVDHLIYGWVFFGIVMFLAFWIGSFFRDEAPETEKVAAVTSEAASPTAFAGVAVLCIAFIIGLYALTKRTQGLDASAVAEPELSLAASSWEGPMRGVVDFRPAYSDFDYESAGRYVSERQNVDVVVQTYAAPEKELINALNFLSDGESTILLSTQIVTRDVGGERWRVTRSVLVDAGGRRVVLSWFQIGDWRGPGSVDAKLRETLGRVLGRSQPRSLVTVSALVDDTDRESELLSDFLSAHGERISRCIVEPGHSSCAGPGAPP